MCGTMVLAFSTNFTSMPRRAAFSSAASASVASMLMVVGCPVTFQMPFTVNLITTPGKRTASQRPARIQTTILRTFDLNVNRLEGLRNDEHRRSGYYRRRAAGMLNMGGNARWLGWKSDNVFLALHRRGCALGSPVGGGAWSVFAGGPRIFVRMGFS